MSILLETFDTAVILHFIGCDGFQILADWLSEEQNKLSFVIFVIIQLIFHLYIHFCVSVSQDNHFPKEIISVFLSSSFKISKDYSWFPIYNIKVVYLYFIIEFLFRE
jgi:hypothetical protein